MVMPNGSSEAHKRPYHWAEDELVRFLAKRGLSARAISVRLRRRTRVGVLYRARVLGVRIRVKGGAPAGNRNGEANWYRKEST